MDMDTAMDMDANMGMETKRIWMNISERKICISDIGLLHYWIVQYRNRIKGTVQRKLRGVKLYISRFVSLWAVVASLWFCQEYSCHFEIHEKPFSTI
jgi:hypothetical protein